MFHGGMLLRPAPAAQSSGPLKGEDDALSRLVRERLAMRLCCYTGTHMFHVGFIVFFFPGVDFDEWIDYGTSMLSPGN